MTEHDCGARVDELDREYYRSKLEELSWCLPVVRAAKAYKRQWRIGSCTKTQAAMFAVFDAVEAMEKAEGKS